MCCIKIFRCGISSSLCHVLHRCLSALAPDDFAPDCEPSIVPDIFPVERPIVTPHAVPPPERPLDEAPARDRPARARDPASVAARAVALPRAARAAPRVRRVPPHTARCESHCGRRRARGRDARARAHSDADGAPMARDTARPNAGGAYTLIVRRICSETCMCDTHGGAWVDASGPVSCSVRAETSM